jgi:hypothetical protein
LGLKNSENSTVFFESDKKFCCLAEASSNSLQKPVDFLGAKVNLKKIPLFQQSS